MIELRMPNITGLTDREQLLQIKSYLYQLIPQLQWTLEQVDASIGALQQIPNDSEISSRIKQDIVQTLQLPLPQDEVDEGWSPDELASGIYVVTDSKPLQTASTTIMGNGVLIQMTADFGEGAKIQLAFPNDASKSAMCRIYWYGNWGDWRNF